MKKTPLIKNPPLTEETRKATTYGTFVASSKNTNTQTNKKEKSTLLDNTEYKTDSKGYTNF